MSLGIWRTARIILGAEPAPELEGVGEMVAERDLYCDAERVTICFEGDPRSAFLVARKGQLVEARFVDAARCAMLPPAKVEPAEAAPAKAAKPAADKQRKPRANKSR